MYFPYLRGRREEVFAVLKATFLTDLTVPIFEPITSASKDTKTVSTTTVNQWQRAIDEGRRFAIITNSANGTPPPEFEDVCGLLEHELLSASVFPALEIRGGTDLAQVRGFARRFEGRTCVVIHRNNTYEAHEMLKALQLLDAPVHVLFDGGMSQAVFRVLPARGRVLLKAGFEYHQPNATYPRRTNFGDLLHTYQTLGFDGFGDFAIVRDYFSPGGGAANCVALHLTEITQDTVITHHFKSSPPHISGDTVGKSLDALRKLTQHASERMVVNTLGVQEFFKAYSNQKLSLAVAKRWGILHHLEIIERELANRRAEPFI